MSDGEKNVISLPSGPHAEHFKWQFDLFWYCHKRIYGADAHRRVNAFIVKRNDPSAPRIETLQWHTDMPHTLCEAFFDIGIAPFGRFELPFNIQGSLLQTLACIPDDTIVELIHADVCHIRPAPVFEVKDNELIVDDACENWYLKSKGANRHVIEPYLKNGGDYNGGFVPVIGKAKTFKAILPLWITIHKEILTRPYGEDIRWWAGTYALQAACENARVRMIGKDLCYFPGFNTLQDHHYIAHYSVDRLFDKRRYPNVDRSSFPDNVFYSMVGDWMDTQRVAQIQVPARTQESAPAQECRVRVSSSEGNGRYLLIKSWGCGFWSDVDHVLGTLLVAEITGRTPIVHWGRNCLFHDGVVADAFGSYFEPVSAASIDMLRQPGLTYYPSKWNIDNLLDVDLNKWTGEGSRVWGRQLLNRTEDVVVSDFHTGVVHMVPMIPPEHPMHGKTTLEVYRYLIDRYLRLRNQQAQREIDEFWDRHLAHRTPLLAVHVRGSDKVTEQAHIRSVNEMYEPLIRQRLLDEPDLSIFLLTDTNSYLNQFRSLYGDRLIHTECARTDSEIGVHYQAHPRTRLALDVIRDTYLAARCHYFLGNGASTVSATIANLKVWPPGRSVLLDKNLLLRTDLACHSPA